jgi:hypothetical protein
MELPEMLKGESLKRLALGAFAGFLASTRPVKAALRSA